MIHVELKEAPHRAEGALSIVAPENIVENRSVLKDKNMKQHLAQEMKNQTSFGRQNFFMTLLISPAASLLCNIS